MSLSVRLALTNGCFNKPIYYKLVVTDLLSVFNCVVQYSVDVTCILSYYVPRRKFVQIVIPKTDLLERK